MKPRYTVALSICAGLAIGAAAVQALHAQAKPPAYVIAEIDVMDPGPYDKEYVPPAAKAIADGGGKYVVRGGETVVRRSAQTAHCRDGLREHGKSPRRV